MSTPPRWGGLATYLVWLTLFLVPPNLLLVYRIRHSPHTVDAREKMARFRRAGGSYDLVFVGDSRAYCDFDPEQLDPLLATRSVNLSYWAHWFPTQYPSFQDLIPSLGSRATVVWSIGHLNFRPAAPQVNAAYPIGIANLFRYLAWGYPLAAIEDNVAGAFLDVLPIHAYRDRVRSTWDGVMASITASLTRAGGTAAKANPAGDRGVASEAGHMTAIAPYDSLRARLERDPTVERVRPFLDQGRVTSLEVFKKRGNYTRIELDSASFRARQRELARAIRPGTTPYTAAPEYWSTFVATLDLFQSHNVRLIVNEMEEAPYHYVGPDAERYRGFMKSVRRYVESRGIPYVRVPWEHFSDADYFDFNHLNSRGIARFTPLVADSLRPLLR